MVLDNYSYQLDKIQDPAINKLITTTLELYGSKEKAEDAAEVFNLVHFLLDNDKLIAENSYALFVDVLYAAALTHNLTYSYGVDKFHDVFKTRDMLEFINTKESIGVPDTYLESICQTVEGQLGKDHPVVALIPNPNTPGMHFALACSLYYKLLKK